MTKTEIAKKATSFVVGLGTTTIVRSIVQNNVAPENVTQKVTVTAGTVVLGSMVADVSKAYTDAKIDQVVAWWKTNVNK